MNERTRIGVKIVEAKAIHSTSLVRRRRIERLKAVRKTIINSNENKDLTEMETIIESESKRNCVSNRGELYEKGIQKLELIKRARQKCKKTYSISYNENKNMSDVKGETNAFQRIMISELFK